MKPMTEHHLALFRRHMVEIIDMHFDLNSDEIGRSELDPHLRAALMGVPRHLFVPQSLMLIAYQDTPLPIGFDKTISQPFIAALMIELLGIDRDTRVLEVGTGLGYQSAVMAEMGGEVWSVDVVEEFVEAALERFSLLQYDIQVRVGDGSHGWTDHAPFDRVLVTAAAADAPPALIEQLRAGGRMVIPLGGQDVQQLSVVEKEVDGEVTTRAIMPVRFTQLEMATEPPAPV